MQRSLLWFPYVQLRNLVKRPVSHERVREHLPQVLDDTLAVRLLDQSRIEPGPFSLQNFPCLDNAAG